jgi:hypothetical protein
LQRAKAHPLFFQRLAHSLPKTTGVYPNYSQLGIHPSQRCSPSFIGRPLATRHSPLLPCSPLAPAAVHLPCYSFSSGGITYA